MIDFNSERLARIQDEKIRRKAGAYAMHRWQRATPPFRWRTIFAQFVVILVIAIVATIAVAEVAAATRKTEVRNVPVERRHVIVVAAIH